MMKLFILNNLKILILIVIPTLKIEKYCFKPLFLGRKILLTDTGAAIGENISAVNIKNLTFIQSDDSMTEWMSK